MFLIFDTETTGLPRNFNAPLTDFDNWPRVVQVAWQRHDKDGSLIEAQNFIIRPEGFDIPYNATKIHGITTEHALNVGKPLNEVLSIFLEAVMQSKYLVGHNVGFDINVMGCEFVRMRSENPLEGHRKVDTCTETTAGFCQLPGGKGGRFKLPNLTELHKILFNEGFGDAHNASADVEATARVFLELVRRQVFPSTELPEDEQFFVDFKTKNPDIIQSIGLSIQSNKEVETAEKKVETVDKEQSEHKRNKIAESYCHLRNHTTYSILNSTTSIENLVKQAAKMKMPAVGLTDTANLMAAFMFVSKVEDYNEKALKEAKEKGVDPPKPLKAILGSEFYVCRDCFDKSVKDNGSLVPIYAKNKEGYKNLSMLSSISHTEGSYYVPRIDKEVLLKYKDNLIVTTGSISGDVPNLLLNIGEIQAEQALIWWKENFGEDFYIELNRHGLEDEDYLNSFLLKMAKKHNIKYFASNNTYYLDRSDADSHDYLLCIKDDAKKAEPVGRGRGYRFAFPNDQFYFKSQDEMWELFSDLPEAFDTITEIINKVEPFTLKREIALPEFEIPEQFVDPSDKENHTHNGENKYLRYLAFEGAKKRYPEITKEIEERLEFELQTIEKTGFPGYFLIVQDLIRAARNMGVWVGPGRGSAAGSIVAYCIEITNIDPLKYGLLFERFLNPERISMPDIDIDFDDEGRSKVVDYAVNKYGQNHVAQIITYGTLGTKSAIRDVGRVLDTDLSLVNKLAALTQNVKLGDFFTLNEDKLKDTYKPEQLEAGNLLKKKLEDNDNDSKILSTVLKIEGLVRNTGIHACGHIIAPTDMRELVPVTVAKDSKLWVTQFDNSVAETAGLLKIDFLGLKTLSLIRDAIQIIKHTRNIDIIPDEIPLDDPITYELFQRGDTIGIFQYESVGMQKNLRELKPTTFADLIAMNALFRPGPMAYIPDFIKRKHGETKVVYDLPEMAEFLEETYGITVYQEQVMLLSQKLANFTKGQADTMRKAMGKKKIDILNKMKLQFMEGGKQNNHPEKTLEKIWDDWTAFAKYAFNKSHSTGYAYVAFQTAYLKAHYPAEFMASVLSNNLNDIKQVTFFVEECRRMGLSVLGPDINESDNKFTVNTKGEIRSGLGGIRNMGEAAAESILEERRKTGPFKDFLDFLMRINLRNVNKRNIEALAKAGAFDSLDGIHRAVFFYKEKDENQTFLEKAIKFANQANEAKNSSQFDLFGNEISETNFTLNIPSCPPWNKVTELKEELESVGFYISSHPIDVHQIAIKYFANSTIQEINKNLENLKNNQLSFAGQVTSAQNYTSQNGNQYGRYKIEDKTDSIEIALFKENYLKFKHLFVEGEFLLIFGMGQKSYRDPNTYELKIMDVQLLRTQLEKTTKQVLFKLNINEMTQESMTKFINLLKSSPGNQNFTVKLIDTKNGVCCNMIATKGKINAQEVLPKIEDFGFVEFDLR